MSIETGVLVGYDGQPIQWHLPPGRNAGSLPDSRDLWEVIWENRYKVLGFAHSHPGGGVPGPSWTDITTFEAVEKALGRELVWWITSSDATVAVRKLGRKGKWVATQFDESNLLWLPRLRELSYSALPYEGYKEYDPWLQKALAEVIRLGRVDMAEGRLAAQRICMLAPSVEAGEEFSQMAAGILSLMVANKPRTCTECGNQIPHSAFDTCTICRLGGKR